MTGMAKALGLGVLLSAIFIAGAGNAAAATKIVAGELEWSPNTVTIPQGGAVEFENPSLAQAQGVEWKSGPATPSCTGVPGTPAQVGPWSGSCTFTTVGTYQFASTTQEFMVGAVTVTGPEAPSVSTTFGEATGDSSAGLHGTVNPNQLETEFRFRYGPSTSYGQATGWDDAGGGSSPVAAGATITGLEPATTYHFQLVAKNSDGERSGGDRTFTTWGPPTVSTGNTTGVSTSGATLLGVVNPFGHETSYWFEWGTDSSYGHITEARSAGAAVGSVTASIPLGGLSRAASITTDWSPKTSREKTSASTGC